MKLIWECKRFPNIPLKQFYRILRARQEVFILEQNCNYLDCDGKDKKSYHMLAYKKQDVAAYMRILPPGLSYKEASMGRILTTKKYRGKGIGKELMERGLAFSKEKLKYRFIRMSAQSYLVPFYSNFGFQITGKEYLEDNIPHTEMILKLEP